MSDEIQFGEVEQSEPEVAVRPDQDAHFATAEIGEVRPDELTIFVDLDVMRDMEAHALSNTRVELGGVMLGKQLLDDEGQPYVLITDSLRAEHYEATKGSFKFTHDTWSQITRQRAQFHPDLEMVGWYHTHPGWSVFLSGMDLFICNNFFNRPLDVALVIDPCEQDRGWFQWTGNDPAQTHRTGGFTLITGRYRQDELDYFARLYNKVPDMNLDPRYSSTPGGSTSVQLLDQRKSTMELAVLGMLAMQFLLFMVFAWRLLAPSAETETVKDLRQQVAELKGEQDRSAREQVYAELLDQRAGQPGFAKEVAELSAKERDAKENLVGQLALNRELERRRAQVASELLKAESKNKKLETQLVQTRSSLDQKTTALKSLQDSIQEDGTVVVQDWWLISGVSLLTLALGLGAGYFFGGRKDPYESYPAGDSAQNIQKNVSPSSGRGKKAASVPNKPTGQTTGSETRGSMVISDDPE